MTHSHLRDLYPFLHGDRQSETAEDAALLESVQQKAQQSRAVAQAFFEHNAAALIQAARALGRVFSAGGKLLCMGNGGSSCDAAHLAVEFLHPVTAGRPALPALNLAMDVAMLSAVGNDLGMRHVFRRQVEVHARPVDGLIGFSASGNSENLLLAYEKARQLGLLTLGLAGGDGGEMRTCGLVDHCLVVETDSIHHVQEVHVAAYHLLWDLTHTLLADERGQLRRPDAAARANGAAQSGSGALP